MNKHIFKGREELYVKVQNGAKLTLDAAGEVNIISDFDVDLGSEFEIIY